MKPTTLYGLDTAAPFSRGEEDIAREQSVARWFGFFTALAGGLIFLGWIAEVPTLKALFPGQVEAKANTALCFILLGVALMLKAGRRPARALGSITAHLCSGLAMAIGLLTLGQYVFGTDFGIDQIVVVEPAGATDTVHPGRMAVPTALTFLLLGSAMLLLERLRGRPGLTALVLPTTAISGLAFFGHLYGLPWFASFGPFTPIAAPTGLVSLVLGVGILHAGSSRFLADLRRSAGTIGFAAALLLLAFMGGAVVHNTRALVAANESVSHTEQVIGRLGEVLSAIQDVEIGMRGYLLTADPLFLESYRPVPARVRRTLRELHVLTVDNSAQQERLKELDAVIESRLADAAQSTRLLEKDGLAGVSAVDATEESKRLLDAIRLHVEEMTREERRLLELRKKGIEVSTRKTMMTLGLGMVSSIGLLFAVFRLLRGEIARRMEMAVALRRSEENLAVTLHSIGDAVLATDTAGKITRMNHVAEQLTGWPADEARGRPIAEVFRIVNEETRRSATIPVEQVLATGEIKALANHTVLIARNGIERAIADSAAPIRDGGGRILGVVLVFRDVSAERAAEIKLATALAELAREQARLKFIFDSLPVGISFARTETDGRRTRLINDAHLKICGITREQADEPGAFSRITHPDDRAVQDRLRRQMDEGSLDGMAIDKRYIRSDGQIVWVMYSVRRQRFPDGSYEDLSMVADITKRKHAEAELERFFSLSLDFLCIASADGSFKRASPGITDILGWTVEEFLARPYLEQVHPDDRAATQREVERQLVSGEKVLHFENRYRHKDGSWRTLSWRSAPHGNLMYATARDVTKARDKELQIEQLNRDLALRAGQLEAANKELESFSYSVSHDLRAPLRHVQGYVEMLTREAGDGLSEKARRYLKTIADAAREMGELIDDLLAFSRMGRAEMREAAVDLKPLIEEVRAGLEHAVKDRSIQWKITELPPVRGDVAMLRQAMVNLLGNAVKYTRQRNPAEIEIGCAGREQGAVVLFVRDNGAGFDMKYADKLFGVFQRLHRSDEFEGTGIGLASVRRIISRHGGRIWADGRVNGGATFYFTLPAANAGESVTPLPS